MKSLAIILAACSIGACVETDFPASPALKTVSLEKGQTSAATRLVQERLHAGDYLSSLYAQTHHDWRNAKDFIGNIMTDGIEDPLIRKRAMILAMGSGDAKTAIELAKAALPESDLENAKLVDDNTIALVFLIMDAFDRGDYQGASALVKAMPADGMSSFIGPFLEGWSAAGLNKVAISGLKENAVHLYHAILISDYLKNHDEIEKLLMQARGVKDLSPADMERIADIYAHIEQKDAALKLYRDVEKKWPDDPAVVEKIKALENGKTPTLFKKISSPKQGLAEAFFDISKILFDEYSDESSRVFANMALHLNPDMTEARLLLAHVMARHDRNADAIAQYNSISKDDAQYLESQRKIATLLEDSGDHQGALNILYPLAMKMDDIDSMITIGNIYRRSENYGAAIDAYQKAQKALGDRIPEEYWHLHYVMGMAYERANQWEKAEAQLKDALAFQPEHPYVLNYLGYAWADRGVNLKESLKMIEKAVSLRPDDGYITDSLGWVLYRMGEYQRAVPELEKAVELLPYDPTINDHLGDAYWRVGRKLEARFQWERAKNHSEDDSFTAVVVDKLANGLLAPAAVLGAKAPD